MWISTSAAACARPRTAAAHTAATWHGGGSRRSAASWIPSRPAVCRADCTGANPTAQAPRATPGASCRQEGSTHLHPGQLGKAVHVLRFPLCPAQVGLTGSRCRVPVIHAGQRLPQRLLRLKGRGRWRRGRGTRHVRPTWRRQRRRRRQEPGQLAAHLDPADRRDGAVGQAWEGAGGHLLRVGSADGVTNRLCPRAPGCSRCGAAAAAGQWLGCGGSPPEAARGVHGCCCVREAAGPMTVW